MPQEALHYIVSLCVEQSSCTHTWQHVTGSRHTQAHALCAVQNPASLRGYLHSQLASRKLPGLQADNKRSSKPRRQPHIAAMQSSASRRKHLQKSFVASRDREPTSLLHAMQQILTWSGLSATARHPWQRIHSASCPPQSAGGHQLSSQTSSNSAVKGRLPALILLITVISQCT